jgi:hypothetical protein
VEMSLNVNILIFPFRETCSMLFVVFISEDV